MCTGSNLFLCLRVSGLVSGIIKDIYYYHIWYTINDITISTISKTTRYIVILEVFILLLFDTVRSLLEISVNPTSLPK